MTQKSAGDTGTFSPFRGIFNNKGKALSLGLFPLSIKDLGYI